MIQRWKKLGHIFCPTGDLDWMKSHASNPIADHIYDDIFRIYFSTRDNSNRSNIAWIEIDIKDPQDILSTSKDPVLEPGLIGCFDDSGCSLGSIINHNGKKLLYYMGWNLGVTVPWRNSIGLAVSEDNGQTYKKHALAPIIDRSLEDPYTLSYPWVLRDNGIWHMWYGSNLKWGSAQSDMYHMIKHATSLDGYSWQRDGKTVIDADNESEYAFAKPCVVKDNDLFQMWYAYRGDKYRIGYAQSQDGINWVRQDHKVGLDLSEEGWDSESIEYPYVFDHKGRRYMLYNGNGYGKTGFGIAVMG